MDPESLPCSAIAWQQTCCFLNYSSTLLKALFAVADTKKCVGFFTQIAIYGKGFNTSARDAWELFQSTGIEAHVAYDCSGAVLLMGTILGGLFTGTCTSVWTWYKAKDRVFMVGLSAMWMGMILVEGKELWKLWRYIRIDFKFNIYTYVERTYVEPSKWVCGKGQVVIGLFCICKI